MVLDLSQRIGRAFSRADAVTFAERDLIVDAAEQPGVDSFEDLPEDAQDLLEEIETRPGR